MKKSKWPWWAWLIIGIFLTLLAIALIINEGGSNFNLY